MHVRSVGLTALSVGAGRRGAWLRRIICVASLAVVSMLSYTRASGASPAPVHAFPEAAEHSGIDLTEVTSRRYRAPPVPGGSGYSSGSWLGKLAVQPGLYVRRRGATRQFSTRLIFTVALAAVAFLILRCAFLQARPHVKASHRSLAEGGDDFQACGSRKPTSLESAADPAGVGPALIDKAHRVLLLQEEVVVAAWRTFPTLPLLEGLKLLNVLVSYATLEQTVLSGLLTPMLEQLRKDVASQLITLSNFSMQNAPDDVPHSRQTYRLRRTTKMLLLSRKIRAAMPEMTDQERALLLDQLLTVQLVSWELILKQLIDTEKWTESEEGISFQKTRERLFITACGVLAARRSHLLRIPAALHCLDAFQNDFGRTFLYGPEGVKKAAARGPLAGAEGQIEEVKHEVQKKMQAGEKAVEEDNDEAEGNSFEVKAAFSGSVSPGEPTSTAEMARSRQALTGSAQHLLSNQFLPLSSSNTPSLPGDAKAPAAQEPHYTIAFPPGPSQKPVYSGYRRGWTSGSSSASSSATHGASEALIGFYSGGLSARKRDDSVAGILPAARPSSGTPVHHHAEERPRWGSEGSTSSTSSATQIATQTPRCYYSRHGPGQKHGNVTTGSSFATQGASQTTFRSYSEESQGWKSQVHIPPTSSATQSARHAPRHHYSDRGPGKKSDNSISRTSRAIHGASHQSRRHYSEPRSEWKSGGSTSNSPSATYDAPHQSRPHYSEPNPEWESGNSIFSVSSSTEGALQATFRHIPENPWWRNESFTFSASSADQGPSREPPHHESLLLQQGLSIMMRVATEASHHIQSSSHSSGSGGGKQMQLSPEKGSEWPFHGSGLGGATSRNYSEGGPGWETGFNPHPTQSSRRSSGSGDGQQVQLLHGERSGKPFHGVPLGAPFTQLPTEVSPQPVSSNLRATWGASQATLPPYSGDYPLWKGGTSTSSTSSAIQAAPHKHDFHYPIDSARGTSEGSTFNTALVAEGPSQTPLHQESPFLRGGFSERVVDRNNLHPTQRHSSGSGDGQQVQLLRGQGRGKPFYGVPLGAPSRQLPTEFSPQPDGASTPFDLPAFPARDDDIRDTSSGGNQRQHKQTPP